MSSQRSSKILRFSKQEHALPDTPVHYFSNSNPYPNTPNTDDSDYDEDQEQDQVKENYQYYTIPAHKKASKSPVNVLDADYGVFESKRKKKNILKGLFKRRETNAWQDDTNIDPRMILRPEPEIPSDSVSGYDDEMNGDASNAHGRFQMNSDVMEPGQTIEHVTRRKHTYVDFRGHVNEIVDERILTRSNVSGRSPRIPKTKVEAQFFSNEEEIRRNETLRLRREQAEKLREYERYFVNGMDTKPKARKKEKSWIAKMKKSKEPSSSPINDSFNETIDSLNRFRDSFQTVSIDGLRSNLLSPKTAIEFHRSAASCISALPFGNLAKPFLFFLGSLISNPKSKEGSYLATLVATLSSMILITFCIATYKMFILFWPILMAFIKFANLIGIKI